MIERSSRAGQRTVGELESHPEIEDCGGDRALNKYNGAVDNDDALDNDRVIDNDSIMFFLTMGMIKDDC